MRSRLEQRVAKRLDELNIEWEYEEYTLPYLKPIRQAVCGDCHSKAVYAKRSYTPDFYLPEFDVFLEVKGKFGQTDRMKMRLVTDQHKDRRFIMVFDRDNLIGRKAVTRTRYTEYARKYGMGAIMASEINRRSIKRERT
jgi:hypothetical protein